jgi:capsular exopolysaccharide synthesis family protein
MGRTAEALQRAEKEQDRTEKENQKFLQEPSPSFKGEVLPSTKVMEPLDAIAARLSTWNVKEPIRRVLFTGISEANGSSSAAVHYATAMSFKDDWRVLLVDAKVNAPTLHRIFEIDPGVGGLVDLIKDGSDPDRFIQKVGDSNLHVLPLGNSRTTSAKLFKDAKLDTFLHKTVESYDYVILDGPPVLSAALPHVVGPRMDGVVLVIESGKTRRGAALRAKQELEKSGANIIGVILNNRKYYIPRWIYRRL